MSDMPLYDVWAISADEECVVELMNSVMLVAASEIVRALTDTYGREIVIMMAWDLDEGSSWPLQNGCKLYAKRVV